MTDTLKDAATDKLAVQLEGIEAEIASLGSERKMILGIIAERHFDAIRKAFNAAGKTHGSLTVKAVPGVELEVDIRQTVKWDSDKLMAASSDTEICEPQEAQRVFKFELSVSETVYKNLPDGPLKKAITAARTTKLSEPSIKVKSSAK